jgi:signal transduction histidine kinase
MNFLKLLVSVVIVFFAQNIFAQENGSLFLSGETFKKYIYTFEVEQPYIELAHPEWFSKKYWRYHSGDDLSWKEPIFNDSNWKLFPSDFDLDSISKDYWQGIGWFRLKLIIDSSLFNQPLAMVMAHFGASEIYLDGKLINQFGLPSKDPAIEKTYRPLNFQPIIISLNNKSEHILAVRYSFLQANKLFDTYKIGFLFYGHPGYPGFKMHFGNSKEVIHFFSDSLKKNLLFAIITFIALFLIGIFHASLFLFYSSDRSNLYLAIFNLTVFGFCFTGWLPSYTHLGLQGAVLNSFLWGVLWNFWLPVSMLAFYSVFYKKLPKYVWLYFAGILLMFYEWFINSSFQMTFHTWLSYIVFFDMMRLFIRSILKKEKNAWLVGIGVLLSQFAWILYLNPSMDWANKEFLAYCVFLIVPVTLLIFNATRIAGTNKSLENQLVEVKRLTDLTLEKEIEKQQILNTQKRLLEKQVQDRTIELSQSLENLKSTQSQLIQSAKMASLGNLTSGIAHEIQNPLNFVNNFSEVNKELIAEMNEEIGKGNFDEAKTIAKDITNNEEKIIYHGKRADAIVKGMLQHSRSSSAVKELTDINKLADEYLRLAYHGLRAKDKSFNVTIITDFDESIGNINIIPQDIGRVILNLITNAFYAVNTTQPPNGGVEHVPTVSVSTKKKNGIIEIKVIDNGGGIPKNIVDKIFQPFFTTKPTGQGTGLGLSLSYDIVKAHGGELKVETQSAEAAAQAGKETIGAEFIIQLPIH